MILVLFLLPFLKLYLNRDSYQSLIYSKSSTNLKNVKLQIHLQIPIIFLGLSLINLPQIIIYCYIFVQRDYVRNNLFSKYLRKCTIVSTLDIHSHSFAFSIIFLLIPLICLVQQIFKSYPELYIYMTYSRHPFYKIYIYTPPIHSDSLFVNTQLSYRLLETFFCTVKKQMTDHSTPKKE